MATKNIFKVGFRRYEWRLYCLLCPLNPDGTQHEVASCHSANSVQLSPFVNEAANHVLAVHAGV